MRSALASYLTEVERGLKGLSANRRRLFLRELESHILDEAEARGIEDESGMESLLKEKEPAGNLADELSSEERVDANHRTETALLGGALIGLATGGYLWMQGGWPPLLSVAFGLAHGLAVGAGIFVVRPKWQRVGPEVRLLMAALLGTLFAIPMGFTSLRGFVWTRLYYGAFTGYLLERHSQKRPWWHLLFESLLFTVFDYIIEFLILHRIRSYQFWLELSFNLTLALAVVAALRIRSLVSGRWVLRSQNT